MAFQRDIQVAHGQPRRSQFCGRSPEDQHLCMGRRIGIGLNLIAGRRQYVASLRIDQHCAHGHLAALRCCSRFIKRLVHVSALDH